MISDQPVNHYPNPDTIYRTELPNGAVLLFFENNQSPTVSFSGVSGSGLIHEPEDLPGLGGFLASALMRGSASRDFREIYELLEGSGATLGFSPALHQTAFHGRMLAEDFDMILNLLFEALTAPVFPQPHLAQIRDQILSGLARQAQDPETMVSVIFDRALFGAHPYGRDYRGTPESINAITRENLAAQHARYFGPEETILCVCGGIAPEKAAESFTRLFSEWKAKPQSGLNPLLKSVPVSRPTQAFSAHHEIPEKSQLELIIGSIGPGRLSADYLPVRLGNAILGQFGMMGRIGKSVREDKGLAYYAGSSVSSLPWGGSWEISAGINPENLNKVVDLIVGEVQRFTDEKVSADELADVKANQIGLMPLLLESNAGIAEQLLMIERFKLGLDYLQRYESLVNQVNVDQVLASAAKYLDPAKLVLATAGTLEEAN